MSKVDPFQCLYPRHLSQLFRSQDHLFRKGKEGKEENDHMRKLKIGRTSQLTATPDGGTALI